MCCQTHLSLTIYLVIHAYNLSVARFTLFLNLLSFLQIACFVFIVFVDSCLLHILSELMQILSLFVCSGIDPGVVSLCPPELWKEIVDQSLVSQGILFTFSTPHTRRKLLIQSLSLLCALFPILVDYEAGIEVTVEHVVDHVKGKLLLLSSNSVLLLIVCTYVRFFVPVFVVAGM